MTTPATMPAPSPDLLAALREVAGIREVVVGDATAGVRLDLHDEADPGSVEVAVEAVLRDRFGVTGSTTEVVERMGPVTADGRLALESLVLTAGARVSATVSVTLDGRSAPGSADGSGSADAVVSAILLALEELTEDAVIGTIDSARVDPDGIARVRLRLDVDGAEELAEAEAAVLRSAPQAIVRAVLTAVEPHLPG